MKKLINQNNLNTMQSSKVAPLEAPNASDFFKNGNRITSWPPIEDLKMPMDFKIKQVVGCKKESRNTIETEIPVNSVTKQKLKCKRLLIKRFCKDNEDFLQLYSIYKDTINPELSYEKFLQL